MVQKKSIDAVVVLYQPDIAVIDNITSYIDELQCLYVVDNSETANQSLIKKLALLPQCKYVNNGGNKGIANALNVGAKLAIEAGATWLLTMDQDSKFEPDAFAKLLQYTTQCDDKAYGVISPFHKTKISVLPKTETDIVLTTMTSGNIISLFAWQTIGGFDEDYFIDAVDWDYCMRLTSSNFKVIRLNTVFLEHNLGNVTKHTAFSRKDVMVLNYNPTRRYYITRNKLKIIAKYRKLYPGFSKGVFKSLFRDLRHIVLYEKGKLEKLGAMAAGVTDFVTGKKGKKR